MSAAFQNHDLISVAKDPLTFHLHNRYLSYVLGVDEQDILAHHYYGSAVDHYSNLRRYPRLMRHFAPSPETIETRDFSLSTLPQEFPGSGGADYREPAIVVKLANGSQTVNFLYDSYTITAGKPELPGLPATFANEDEAQTLTVKLVETDAELELYLHYTIFRDLPVITRSSAVKNVGQKPVQVERLFSFSLDSPDNELDLLHLNGRYAQERNVTVEPLSTGIKILDSKRGASGHTQNPFCALVDPHATEHSGEVFGFSLIYSGSHKSVIQMDGYNQVRVQMGINDQGFAWWLEPQKVLQSPEAVLVHSGHGLNEMSQAFHQLFLDHLMHSDFSRKERPILLNNWEATYFNFNEDDLKKIIASSHDLGIEMFVLDDGWFGERDAATSSLGDWVVDRKKLPNGLKPLSDYCHQLGMQFGLWFEPEMISVKSKLYQDHPNWVLEVPGQRRSIDRSQFVLNLGRQEVRDYLLERMSYIIEHAGLDYIKWDMNRNMTEVYDERLSPDEQGEVSHRYILGLYDLLDALTQKYPQVLFESCSGGGGRYDAGMLYYMPQTWTSDNTDAIARLKIQYGTSLVYPIVSMGAHVSAVPNEQTGRMTPLRTRGLVASSGNLGYELNPLNLLDNEKQEVKQQVAWYKEHRALIQFGRFYRIQDPFKSTRTAWMFVSPDKKQAVAMYFNVFSEASMPLHMLNFVGLDPAVKYSVNGEYTAYGSELMHIGIYPLTQNDGDFDSAVFELKAVEQGS
ncbi:alpha-galactosidase [Ligilactobacillus salitolerans]|uniref:Alpha-galactosidase n=1 Tax=Ligilactobacillus salitolerans TaxID=1808352 RepID=A0A401IVR9_9LACO|nr:alpha-galactosidase [Ligilactobacillus salitolerans]GBG95605.1 alpha-galactosidase [Ligilactobacillus salitolerans]